MLRDGKTDVSASTKPLKETTTAGRTMGTRQPGSYPRRQTIAEAKTSLECRKYAASKLNFPHAEELLRKLYPFRERAIKKVGEPCPRPKKVKEYRCERAPDY